MNDDVRALAVKARNGSYEMMLTAQAMKDKAVSEAEKRIAEYLDIDERNARKRLHKAGYVTPEGAKGLWVEPKGKTDADETL